MLTSSPSLRNWRRACRMLRTVAGNAFDEFRYAPLGVRRSDLWRDDELFLDLLHDVRSRTLLSPSRLFCLYQLAHATACVPGSVAELGVFRGGSAKLLSRVLARSAPDKRLHLFDTFEGLPVHDPERDAHRKGELNETSFEEVKEFLGDSKQLEWHQGLFSNTFPQVSEERFCLVHVDADLYASVWECCEFFYPRMSPGAVLLFDDYGFVSCPGAREAVDEFFSGKADSPLYVPTGQCMVIKCGRRSESGT